MVTKYQEAWHTLAVGLYYRDIVAGSGNGQWAWEQQNMATKLHYQAKAKQMLAQVCNEAVV